MAPVEPEMDMPDFRDPTEEQLRTAGRFFIGITTGQEVAVG